jgi:hypothetical protein
MRSRPTQVAENVRVCATCLLQSIRENREPSVVQRAFRQVTLLVGSLGEAYYRGVLPGEGCGINADVAERKRAMKIVNECCLSGLFGGVFNSSLVAHCTTDVPG